MGKKSSELPNEKTKLSGITGSTQVSESFEIDIAGTGAEDTKQIQFAIPETAAAPAESHRGSRAHKVCPPTDALRAMLVSMMATEEQLSFFDSWIECVGAKKDQLASKISFHTDGSNFEYGLRGSVDVLKSIIEHFLEQCEIPLDAFQTMEQTIKELACEEMSFWCRIKHMQPRTACRNDDFVPSIDAGYMLHCNMNWEAADLIMPQGADQDGIREYMQLQGRDPCGVGASLVPVEPEARIAFNIDNVRLSKRGLLAMLMFYKNLGFVKPEEAALECLSMDPERYVIVVCTGPKGLIRLSGTLEFPETPKYEELCDAIDFTFAGSYARAARSCCGGEPTGVDYSADSRGYTVGLVFETEPPTS